MLESGVEVSLEAQTADDAVVVAVDVCVDSVEALEDLLDGGLEGSGEGHARLGGEEVGVGQQVRGPGEQVGDVAWGGQTRGSGVLGRVVPEVLEFVGGFHFGAGLRTAEFGDGAVDEVDLVVEVDDWNVNISRGSL